MQLDWILEWIRTNGWMAVLGGAMIIIRKYEKYAVGMAGFTFVNWLSMHNQTRIDTMVSMCVFWLVYSWNVAGMKKDGRGWIGLAALVGWISAERWMENGWQTVVLGIVLGAGLGGVEYAGLKRWIETGSMNVVKEKV